MGSRLDRRGAEQPRRRRRLFVQHAENTEEYVGPVERERPAVEGEGAVLQGRRLRDRLCRGGVELGHLDR